MMENTRLRKRTGGGGQFYTRLKWAVGFEIELRRKNGIAFTPPRAAPAAEEPEREGGCSRGRHPLSEMAAAAAAAPVDGTLCSFADPSLQNGIKRVMMHRNALRGISTRFSF
jgi:hypothetical protein